VGAQRKNRRKKEIGPQRNRMPKSDVRKQERTLGGRSSSPNYHVSFRVRDESRKGRERGYFGRTKVKIKCDHRANFSRKWERNHVSVDAQKEDRNRINTIPSQESQMEIGESDKNGNGGRAEPPRVRPPSSVVRTGPVKLGRSRTKAVETSEGKRR